MTIKIKKLAFYLIVTIILTLGLSISLQSLLAAWVAPTASPPSDNTPAPIYASGASQIITGDLGITGNLSAFQITANGDFYANNHTIYMGGADWSIAFSPTYPDYGIFYDEGSPDKIVLSADGGGAADTDFVLNGDKVGIGTESPDHKLQVLGNVMIGETDTTGGSLYLYGTTAGKYSRILTSNGNLHIDPGYGAGGGNGLYLNYYNGGTIYFGTGATGYHSSVTTAGVWNLDSTLYTDGAGNVGIGEINPSQKLDVAGAIQLGASASDETGVIRWSGTDFEGYDGSGWISLTSVGGGASIDYGDCYDEPFSQTTHGGVMHVCNNGYVAVGLASGGYSCDTGCGHLVGPIRCCKLVSTGGGGGGDDDWEKVGGGDPVLADDMYHTGNVGIGTESPEFKLTLDNDGGIIAKGTYFSGAALSTSGAGPRLIWYPRRAVFRAGYVNGAQWDDANIGSYSTATGRNTTASGDSSTAMGHSATASGWISTAMGLGTTASGNFSTAMGREIEAGANYVVAVGLDDMNGANCNQANSMCIMGGNVGIGTANPGAKLDVNGDLNVSGKIYGELHCPCGTCWDLTYVECNNTCPLTSATCTSPSGCSGYECDYLCTPGGWRLLEGGYFDVCP